MVSERIVHVLEAVQIDEQYREPGICLSRFGCYPNQFIVKPPAIRQSRQAVVLRQKGGTFLRQLAIRQVAQNLDESRRVSIFILDRRYHAGRPEA